MLSDLGLGDVSTRSAAVVAGGVLGLLFGLLAQRTRFCLRRGLVGPSDERRDALGTWLMALAVATVGTGALIVSGFVDFAGHRLMMAKLPVVAIVLGGLMFGVGMVLARGCASRLTVLAGSGNLRALTALIVFAAVAHATMKGALAPVRTWLGGFTLDLGSTASLASLPGGVVFWTGVIALAAGFAAVRLGARPWLLAGGAAIGVLAPLGWWITGHALRDEFDPIPLESLALTSAGADSLFWWVASSAIAPTFGVGLLAGVLAGSAIAAIAAREFAWEGFTEHTPTANYLLGAVLMGVGGVLAGGCTVGAGLSGIGSLSVAAILALAAIVGGALAMDRLRALRMTAARDGRSRAGSLAIAARAISL